MTTRNFSSEFLKAILFDNPPDGVEIVEMSEAHSLCTRMAPAANGVLETVFKLIDEWKFYAIDFNELYGSVRDGGSVDCTEVVPRIKQVIKYEEV